MDTLNTIRELQDVASGRDIYVRYSRDHAGDIERGYSLNHSTMTREPGLSVQPIRDEDWSEGRGWIARLIAGYAGRTLYDTESYGWVCTGREAGEDADGCPALVDVVAISRLSTDLVARCCSYATDLDDRNRSHKGVNDSRPWPEAESYGI